MTPQISAQAKHYYIMNDTLVNISRWFGQNKLNLNPSKTRYMIFNSKTPEVKLIKIHDEYIE